MAVATTAHHRARNLEIEPTDERRKQLRARRVRRVRGLALFAAIAPFLTAVSVSGYSLFSGRTDILIWTIVPWIVFVVNLFAYVWAPRRLRVSRAIILWSVFIGLAISVLTFGMEIGGMSLFLAWTVVLAAMLYGPAMAITATVLSVFVVILTFVLEHFHIIPWIPLQGAMEDWVNFSLAVVYPVAMAGSVYMYADYIQETLIAAGSHLQQHANVVVESAQQQAAAAQQQAAAIQEISATAEELSRTAEQIAASSRQLDEIAERSYERMEEGEQVIGDILETIQHFAVQMQTVLQHALQMDEHSRRIGEIVELIGRISDETHLIALNAAIEAASAGEHGQRFSVIAAEIRRLSEHAITSGNQIKSIVQDFQQTAQSVVMSMESEVQQVETMEEQAKRAGEHLRGMVESVEVTRRAAQELAGAAADLKDVSQQLAQSLHEMSQAADGLASTSRRTLEVAEALNVEAAAIATSGV